ncbi:fused uroporphyrinogen-III synthase HemD/membrane protein HemX [Ralstonia sp. ASV6]|uniref:fused uroporphyrinogen-III synthase HemD/membrane protein HemX n=1 Tax=Ralstonia sp. ASV6 TaxID=2795124 RepID=UPI0018EBA473|nr:fused uroporphyrinogen-III synthase HemD/membrane protein HemX [Ralstonia sp. ASV6]
MDDRLPPSSSALPVADSAATVPVVVVTRPRAQAPMLVTALERHGLRTHQFPLLDIAPTPNLDDLRAALGDPSRYALVVFVSPNAVQQAFAAMPEGFRWPQEVPVAVVGPASAQALATHGVAPPAHRVIRPDTHADDARQDSEALYARLDVPSLSGREVLIVRGNGGREWLADQLREAGVSVRTVEAYRRSVPVPDAAAWAALRNVLATRHAWTLTSSEAVRNLDDLARANLTPAEVNTLHGAPCFAPHARIVEQAESLGFRDVKLTGAGDDRLLAGVLAWAGPVPASVPTPPAPAPAESNTPPSSPTVTQTPVPSSAPAAKPAAAQPSPAPAVSSAPASFAPTMTVNHAPRRGGWLIWAVLAVIVVAVAALQVRNERLAREIRQRGQQNEALAQEMRVLSSADRDAVGQLQQKFGALDARTTETRDRQGALEQASQDLLRNRDDWQRAEIERSIEVAAEQLQLTGNVSGALAALQTVDARLAALNKPQFNAVRRAVARDIAKLKAMPSIDLSGAAIRLDDAINAVDTLPLVSSAQPLDAEQAAQAPKARPAKNAKAVAAASASAPAASTQVGTGWSAGVRAWWGRLWSDVRGELGQIVQVRRVDQTEALLLSSDQAWFLRENLKLRLMNARLALLSRNDAVFRADLGRADTLLARYFDTQSQRVTAVQNLLAQVRTTVGTLEVPTLADSLAAARGQGKE